MAVLVTGAAGFIGAHISRFLVGHVNLLEVARQRGVRHVVYA